jgi:hypothetical protein
MSISPSKSFLVLLFAATASFGALAADDPGIHQVYEAANSGHLDQARSMMAQVLKDHPDSAKAHYVAAEIDARGGDFGSARGEFQTAEKLAPGLPFAKPYAVQELRGELYSQQAVQQPRVVVPGGPVRVFQQPAQMHGGFPWGGILGIAFVVWIVWMIFRRFVGPRPMYPVGGGMGGGYGPGGGYYGGGYPPPAGGGLLGSLGTGMAVGAGVVAGEEIAHHLLDGNGRVIERDVVQSDDPGAQQNGDMGGSDFGISDNSSWDNGGGDSGGGIDGGGDNWS